MLRTSWRRKLAALGAALVAAGAVAVPVSAGSPDTVKFDTAEIGFGLLDANANPWLPGTLAWNFDFGLGEWRPALFSFLGVKNLTAGVCVRLHVHYKNGSDFLGHDSSDELCSTGSSFQQIWVLMDDFTDAQIERAEIYLQQNVQGTWTTVESKTRVNN